MATRDAMQIREEAAVGRLTAAATALATAAGIEAPDFATVPPRGNLKMAEIERVEMVADFLESLNVEPPKQKKAAR